MYPTWLSSPGLPLLSPPAPGFVPRLLNQREFLQTAVIQRSDNIEVALRIDGKGVGAGDVARSLTGAAIVGKRLAGDAVQNVDLVVGAVGHVGEFLLRVGGKVQIAGPARLYIRRRAPASFHQHAAFIPPLFVE